jgi:hypothetical protein
MTGQDWAREMLAEVLARLDEARIKEAKAWVVVALDETDTLALEESVTYAVGPFEEPLDAVIEMQKMEADDARFDEPGEPGWKHAIVPLWPPSFNKPSP